MKNQADVLREIAHFLGHVAINGADTKDREIAHFLGHVAINGADTKDREIALALEQDARALAQQPQQGAVVEALRAFVRAKDLWLPEPVADGSCSLEHAHEMAALDSLYERAVQALTPAPSEPTDTEEESDFVRQVAGLPNEVDCLRARVRLLEDQNDRMRDELERLEQPTDTDTERGGDLQYDIEEILIDAEPRNDSPGQLAHNIMEKVRAAVDAAMKQQGGGA